MKKRVQIGMAVFAAVALLAGGEARAQTSGRWKVDAGGNWNDGTKWTITAGGGTYPDGIGQSASLTNNLTLANVVVVQNVANITLGSLTIGDSGSTYYTYTLTNTGSETITLDADGAGGGVWITKNRGDQVKDTIAVPIILKGNLSITNTIAGAGTTELSLDGVISEAGGKRNVTARTGGTTAPITLNGANAYSGKTTLEIGTLLFNSIKNVSGGASALGAPTTVADGTIAIGNGANACLFAYTGTGDTTDRILDLVGTTGSVTLDSRNGKLTCTSDIKVTGSGAKTLILKPNTASGSMELRGAIPDSPAGATSLITDKGSVNNNVPIALLGASTYSGTTEIQQHIVTINSIADENAGVGTSLGNPAAGNGTINMGLDGNGPTLKYIGLGHSSGRAIALPNTSTGGATLDASGYGKLTLSGLVTNSGAGSKTLTLTGTGEGELSGVISDYDATRLTSLTKSGGGTWTLKGNNTFTGTVTLNGSGGRLIMGHANALGLGSGTITLTAGTLDPGDADRTIANPITVNTPTIAGSKNVTLSGKVTGVIGSTATYRTLSSSLDANKVLTLSGGLDLVATGDTTARNFTLAGTGDTTINSVIANGNTYANGLILRNRGTTKINKQNTYTGSTGILGGGTVILNYDTGDGGENASHLANANLYLVGLSAGGTQLGGADLVLQGGDHAEILGATTYWGNGTGSAGHINVSRSSGTATLVMGAINSASTMGMGTINFAADDLASTTTANLSGGTANGILGDGSYGARAPATVAGTDWACNSGVAHPSGGNYIRAYTGYVALATSVGSSATNYTQTGNTTLTGDVLAGTLKLLGNGTLYLGSGTARNLNVSFGVLYAGTEGQTYTISDNGLSGTVFGLGGTPANIHVKAGELVFDCGWGPSATRHLVKTGKGRLTLQKASTSTGTIYVNEGAVRLKNSTASGTTALGISVAESVYGSALELEGGIAVGSETNLLHGTGISNGGAMRNISGNNSYAGPITIHFQGGRINSDQDTLTLSGGVTTAAGQDVTFGGAGNITVSTVKITGAGNVTKDGAGTLELAAANDYTGATAVNAGTLKVTGSIGAGSLVTVNSGATISGNGTCGEVRVKAGATIKPEGGNLTVSNLVLFAGCTNVFDVDLGRKIVVSQSGSLADQQGLTIVPGAKVLLTGTVNPNSTNNLIQYSGAINGNVTNLVVADPKPLQTTYTFITNGGYVAVVAGAAGSAPVIEQSNPVVVSMNEDFGTTNLALGQILTAYDADSLSNQVTWSLVGGTGPANGTAVVSGVGTNPVGWTTFTYTPFTNFYGTNQFTVMAQDEGARSAVITVRVDVAAVNDLPVKLTDPVLQSPASLWLFNDVWTNTPGTWQDNADTNTAGYTDNTFQGAKSFLYQWQWSNSATMGDINLATNAAFTPNDFGGYIGTNVRVKVWCVDGGVPGSVTSAPAYSGWQIVQGAPILAPVITNAGPLATTIAEDAASTDLQAVFSLLATNVAEASTLTWSLAVAPTQGTAVVSGGTESFSSPGTFTYQPWVNRNGGDSFVVCVSNGVGILSSNITVNIDITAVNDAPSNTVAPGYTGTRLWGSTLTATNGVWDDNADTNATYTHAVFTNTAAFTYQWQRTDSTNEPVVLTNLQGKTTTTYELTHDDKYKWFRVQVTCTDSSNGVPVNASNTAYSAWLRETSTVPAVVVFTNALNDGAWGSYSNWVPDDVPTTNLTAVVGDANVRSPATAAIGASDTAAAKNLYIATNAGSVGAVNMTGGTLTFPAAGSITVAGAASSTGTLNQTGGAIGGITAGSLTIASGDYSKGTVVLGGDGTAITSAWTIASGANSDGTLVLTNNAIWVNTAAARTIGSAAGAKGTLSVASSAVAIMSAQAVTLGSVAGSTGSVEVSGQGMITNVTTLAVGGAGGGYGEVKVTQTGLVWATSSINIGGTNNNSYVLVADSGVLRGRLSVASANYSSGTLILTNKAIYKKYHSSSTSYVGDGANAVGDLKIYDTAVLDNSYGVASANPLTIGNGAGSTGRVEVMGFGAITNVSILTLGNSGYGSLTVRDAGTVAYANDSAIGNSAGGQGVLTVTNNAVVTATGGTVDKDLILGNAAGATGEVIVAGNGIMTNANFTVGNLGYGSLTVKGAGALYNANISMGFANGSNAAMTVSGSAYVQGPNLQLGNAAGNLSTLDITGGEVLANGSGADGESIGYARNSTGLVTIAGGRLTLGKASGSTSYTISIGTDTNSLGRIVVNSGNLSILNMGDSGEASRLGKYGRGEILLNGGSFTNEKALDVGWAAGGYGLIQVSGGTWVQANALNLGATSGGTGVVTVANTVQTNITGAITVGGGGAGDRYGSITVSNATFGGGTAVSVLTNGFVELTGTGSVFLCNTFANNGGYVTNRVRSFSGGLDITNKAGSSLVATNIYLSFEGTNQLDGTLFWGLRWAGHTNSINLRNMLNLGQIKWGNTIASGPYANATLVVHTNADYAYLVLNRPPTIDQGATLTTNITEGSGAISLANRLTAVDDGAGGSTVTWSLVSGPAYGTLAPASPSGTGTNPVTWGSGFSYTPMNAQWNGTDSFVMQATDALGASNRIEITVVVAAVNDAPVCTAQPLMGAPDGMWQVGKVVTNLSSGAWDDNLDTNTALYGVTGTSTLTVTSQWMRATQADGSDAVPIAGATNATYTIQDPDDLNKYLGLRVYSTDDGVGSGGNQATVTNARSPSAPDAWYLITAVNSLPVITNASPVIVTLTEGCGATDLQPTMLLYATDEDGGEAAMLVWTNTTAPAYGTVSVTGTGASPGTVTFTPPNTEWYGTNTFTMKATDPKGGFALAQIEVRVDAVNDAPVCTAAPAVSGTCMRSNLLTGTTGVWNDNLDTNTALYQVTGVSTLTLTSQWMRASDGSGTGAAAIDGATNTAYMPGAADVGMYVRLQVYGTDDGVGNGSPQTTVTNSGTWTLVEPATPVWTGSGSGVNTQWNQSANWNPDTPASGESIIFAGIPSPLNGTNSVMEGNYIISNITFNSGATGYLLRATGGGVLTNIGASVANNSLNAQTITLPMDLVSPAVTFSTAPGDIRLGGVLSGAGSIIKDGSGTLTLSNASTFAGGILVKAGTVVGNTSANAFGRGTITIGATNGAANAMLVGGTAGPFTNALVVASGNTGTVTISNTVAATFSGGLTLNSHDVTLASVGSGLTISNGVTGTGSINAKAGNGAVTLAAGSAINMTGAITNSGSGTGSLTISGPLGANVTKVVQDSSSSDLSMIGSHPNFGGGIVILNGKVLLRPNAQGNNTGTGTITIGAGSGSANATLSANNNAGAALPVTNAIVVASGNTGEAMLALDAYYVVYDGGVTLNSHNLSVSNASSGYLIVSNNVSGTGSITLKNKVAGGTITLGAGGSINIIGSITNLSGAATNTISGALGANVGNVYHTSGGVLNLSGNNSSFTGTVMAASGTLRLGHANALGTTGAGTTVSSGGALDLWGQDIATAEPVTLNGTGVSGGGALLNGSGTAASLAGPVTLASASLIAASGTGGLTLTGGIQNGGYELTFGGFNDATVSGTKITGGGALVMTGAGILTLGVANDYAGNTMISNGTLRVSVAGAIPNGSGKGDVSIENVAALDLNGVSLGINGLNGAGGFVANGAAGAVTLTVGNNNASGSFGGSIMDESGTVALTKTGSGTQTLTADNPYSGTTTIGGGTLALSGSGAITGSPTIVVSGVFDVSGVTGGAYALSPGQTLKGTGTVVTAGGSLVVTNTGILSPGSSPGTLTVNGNVTLASGGTYRWEVDQVDNGSVEQTSYKGTDPGADYLHVTGSVTFAATSGDKFVLDLRGLSHATHSAGAVGNWTTSKSNKWALVTADGGISGFDAAAVRIDTANFFNYNDSNTLAAAAFTVTADANSIYLNFAGVPAAGSPPVITNAGPLAVALAEDAGTTNLQLLLNLVATNADAGESMTWSVKTPATNGTVLVEGSTSELTSSPTTFTYRPNDNVYGGDSFEVKVSDPYYSTSITVNVTLVPVNDAPTNTAAPSVSGAVMAHSNVWLTSAGTERWNDNADTNDSAGSLTFAYMWQRADDGSGMNAADIGVTTTNYTVTGADRGKWIRIREICTDSGLPLPAISVTNYSGWYQETSVLPTLVILANTTGNWTDYSKWTPDAVPTTNITAVVGDANVKSPATAVIGASDTAAAKNLYIATNAGSVGTVNMTDGTLTFPAAGAITVAGATSSTGTLSQTGGAIGGITSGDLTIAGGDSSKGMVLLGGDSSITSTWSVASGTGSDGTLVLTNSARWKHSTTTTRIVGSAAGAIGRLGVYGNAVMDFDSGGDRGLTLGSAAGSTGELVVADSGIITNVGVLTVGAGGRGRVTIRSNAVVRTSNSITPSCNIGGTNQVGEVTIMDSGTLLGHVRVGATPGSSGTLILTNNARLGTATASTTYVGYDTNATGYLYVRKNAVLNNGVNGLGGNNSRPLTLGERPGSTGIVEIAENGSISNVSTFTVGNLGYGQLTIRGYGVLYQATANPDLIICGGTNNRSSMTVADDGFVYARLRIGNSEGSDGTLTFTNRARFSQAYGGVNYVGNAGGAVGRLLVSDTAVMDFYNGGGNGLTLGSAANSTGIVEVTGGVITNVSTLTVGDAGYGQMTLGGTGTVYATTLTVGDSAGGTGIVSVTDWGSASFGGTLTIGNNGYGSMTVGGTGVVYAGSAFSMGNAAGSNAELVVQGNGRVTNGVATGTFRVGQAAGNVSIVNLTGGSFYSKGGNGVDSASIGYAAGSTGIVTVTGGEHWLVNGGSSAVNNNSLGSGAGSLGRVVINGGALTLVKYWALGRYGRGEVLLNSGSFANDNTLNLGYTNGAYGLVRMTGGTWNQSGTLNVGYAPSGSGGYGQVDVTGGTWVQSGAMSLGAAAGGTGVVTVADCVQTNIAGAITVGGGTTAGDRYGRVTVSNATFGGGTAVTVTNNGVVVLDGTGSVLRCNTFRVNGGTVTNHVRALAGGVDITNTASTALAITNGNMHLVFEPRPEPGVLWGLRWAGNNHSNDVQSLIDAGKLTWDDWIVRARPIPIGVFTNATHTMVGTTIVEFYGTVYKFR